MKRRIYVASSWRNQHQPGLVTILREAGHDVYDFRNPGVGHRGFHWSEIDPAWDTWSTKQYIEALQHPIAKSGFTVDFNAMTWADTFVLVQPCGRSAHLEFGWAVGHAKKTIMWIPEKIEPELMSLMCDEICADVDEVCRACN